MYEIQCAMHPLYDCFVNVPFTGTIREISAGGGGAVEIFFLGGGVRNFRGVEKL